MNDLDFIVMVRRSHQPPMRYECDNEEEVCALRDAFYAAYYPHVAIHVVSRSKTASEFVELEPA